MAKYFDSYVETTRPEYARSMSARFVKIYGKGKTKVKTLGKMQRAGTVGGFGRPSYLVRIRRMK